MQWHRKSAIAEAMRYGLKHREGLRRFLADGRIDIDNNTVERAIRPIALGRKNHLFAGSDEGGVHWGIVASLVETCNSTASIRTATSPTFSPGSSTAGR